MESYTFRNLFWDFEVFLLSALLLLTYCLYYLGERHPIKVFSEC